MRGRDEKKESVLGAIKKYQAEDKEKPKEKKDASKEAERSIYGRCGLRTAPALFLFCKSSNKENIFIR